MSADPAFAKWALGFSGCDGGNLCGGVWFCGIEWGAGEDLDLQTELTRDVTAPPQRYQCPADILRDRVSGRWFQYDAKLLKLIAAMRGDSVSEYKHIAHETPFPFHKDSKYFKLNLFPINFRRVDSRLWTDRYKAITGLNTRDAYLEWCRCNRFPAMRSWMDRGRPKLVVGVGSSCKSEFRSAFGFEGPEHKERIEDKDLVWLSNGTAVLAVIPFLGPFGLNSNKRLEAFGRRLGALLNALG
jgi:hypothetical protein